MEWENIENQEPGKQQAAMSGWSIENLLKDDKLIQVARSEWDRTSARHVHLGVLCTKEDLDKEDESKLTGILNNPKSHGLRLISSDGGTRKLLKLGRPGSKTEKVKQG